MSNPDYTSIGPATCTFLLQPAKYGVKRLTAFDESSVKGFFLSPVEGPSFEGSVKGVLIPPAKLVGGELPGGEQPIAGADILLTWQDTRTSFRTNVLPQSSRGGARGP